MSHSKRKLPQGTVRLSLAPHAGADPPTLLVSARIRIASASFSSPSPVTLETGNTRIPVARLTVATTASGLATRSILLRHTTASFSNKASEYSPNSRRTAPGTTEAHLTDFVPRITNTNTSGFLTSFPPRSLPFTPPHTTAHDCNAPTSICAAGRAPALAPIADASAT